MSGDLAGQIRSYVDAVVDSSGAATPAPPRGHDPGGMRGRRLVLAGLIMLLAAGSVAVAVVAAGDGSSDEVAPQFSAEDMPRFGPDYCPAPISRYEEMTPEREFASEVHKQRMEEEIARSGFQIMKSQSLIDDTWVCGWVEAMESIATMERTWEIIDARATAPLGLIVTTFYDAPAGEVMGFAYGRYGYLPVEVAADGSFDLEGALQERIREHELEAGTFTPSGPPATLAEDSAAATLADLEAVEVSEWVITRVADREVVGPARDGRMEWESEPFEARLLVTPFALVVNTAVVGGQAVVEASSSLVEVDEQHVAIHVSLDVSGVAGPNPEIVIHSAEIQDAEDRP